IRALDGTDAVFTTFTDTVRLTADSDIQVNGTPVSGITTNNFTNGVLDTTITLTTSGLTQIYAENVSINRSGQS
ncbi:MAG TPA: hypothetical protein DD671_17580, partial [Balneolaceae bacterium]|nr:hypothetical protein [Balneolaceae bacterium]